MDHCLFCRLVRNEIPSYTLYEDEHTRAFLDISPCAPGHTMVIPKKHGVTFLDYTPGELTPVFATVQKVAQALQRTYQTEILTIGINHGEKSGVHHFHVHIIPRFPNDGGGVIQSVVKNEPKEGLRETEERIKKNIM